MKLLDQEDEELKSILVSAENADSDVADDSEVGENGIYNKRTAIL